MSKFLWFLLLFSLFILLGVTNRHYSFQESLQRGQTDVRDYKILADSPKEEWQEVPFHHAQRFMVPYGLGHLAHGTGMKLDRVFEIATVLCLVSLLLLVSCILTRLEILNPVKILCIFLVLFNPYLFRFYLAYPGMITDVIFMLGLTLLLSGLWDRKMKWIAFGMGLAAMGRQTAFLLLPPSFLWIWRGLGWQNDPFSRKIGISLLITVEVLAIYGFTAVFVSGNLWGPENLKPISNKLFLWLNDERALQLLLNFFVRTALPLYIPLMILLGGSTKEGLNKIPREVYFLLAFSLAASFLVFSAGLTTAEGHIRFVLHGLIPFILATAIILDISGFGQKKSPWVYNLIYAAIVTGSFHHETSIIHSLAISKVQFGLLHLFSGWVAFGGSYFFKKTALRELNEKAGKPTANRG